MPYWFISPFDWSEMKTECAREIQSEPSLKPTNKIQEMENGEKRRNVLEVFAAMPCRGLVNVVSFPFSSVLMCACCLDTSRPVCPVPSDCCRRSTGVVIVVVILMIMMLFMMRSGSINNLSSAVARPTQDPLDQQPDRTHPAPLQRPSRKRERREKRGKNSSTPHALL